MGLCAAAPRRSLSTARLTPTATTATREGEDERRLCLRGCCHLGRGLPSSIFSPPTGQCCPPTSPPLHRDSCAPPVSITATASCQHAARCNSNPLLRCVDE